MKYSFFNFDYDTHTNRFEYKTNEEISIAQHEAGVKRSEITSYLSEKKAYYDDDFKPIDALYLFLTDECEGGCKYCYIKEEINQNKRFLTPSTLKYSLARLKAEHSFADNVLIRFVGGDPGLSHDIPEIINILRESLDCNLSYDFFLALINSSEQWASIVDSLRYLSSLKANVSLKLTADLGSPSDDFTRTSRVDKLFSKSELFNRIQLLVYYFSDFNISVKTNISKHTDLNVLKSDIDEFISLNKPNLELLFNIVRDKKHSPSIEHLEEILQYFHDEHFASIYTYNDKEFGIGLYEDDLTSDYLKMMYEEYVKDGQLNPTHLSCKVYKSSMLIRPDGSFGNCLLDYIKEDQYTDLKNSPHEDVFVGNEFLDSYKYNECHKCDFFLVCTLCPYTKRYLNCDHVPAFKLWEEFLFFNKLKMLDYYLETL